MTKKKKKITTVAMARMSRCDCLSFHALRNLKLKKKKKTLLTKKALERRVLC